MIQSALMQLINEVKCSQLDFLVLDLPQGTGDVHITILQQLKLNQHIHVIKSKTIARQNTR